MALYTRLTRTEIAKIAALFGLPKPDKIRGILEGTVNTYYRLTYPIADYFLKIDEVGDIARLRNELKILSLLAKNRKKLGFEIPCPLSTQNKKQFIVYKKKPCLLFEKIEGKSLTQLSIGQIRRIGQILARLHSVAQNAKLPPHRFNPAGMAKVYGQIRVKLEKKHPAIALDIRQWLAWLEKNRPANLPCGLIHADLFPENILWAKNKISGILDFEAAGFGPFLFDIAVTLHACCHDGKKFPIPAIKSFLEGYQSIRKLSQKEKNCFEYYLYESAMRFLLTRLRDFELKDGPVKAKPFKDYREYLRRFGEIPALAEEILPYL